MRKLAHRARYAQRLGKPHTRDLMCINDVGSAKTTVLTIQCSVRYVRQVRQTRFALNESVSA